MDANKKVKLSKSLSWLLRHGAVKENLPISADGFIPVINILQHKCFKGQCTITDIEHIVKTDAKSRYVLRINNITRILEIRANQGHSINNLYDLELTPVNSKDDLPNGWAVHGTYHSALPAIKQQGLSRMSRVHIHLSPYEPGDVRAISGMRHNIQILVYVNVEKAIAGGITFFKSTNGVILSEGNLSGFIEPKYFLKIIDTKTGMYRKKKFNPNSSIF